jgi:hypothetical protein
MGAHQGRDLAVATVFLVLDTTPERTDVVAACASSIGAERAAVKFMASHLAPGEPWIQSGLTTWQLRSRRERLDITARPITE